MFVDCPKLRWSWRGAPPAAAVYSEINKGKIKEYQKEYIEKKKEKLNEYQAKSYEDN